MQNREPTPLYLIKLSGELLRSTHNYPIDFQRLTHYVEELKTVYQQISCHLVVVIGGGNIWRGAKKNQFFSQNTAHQMGMATTLFNGLALQGALRKASIPAFLTSTTGHAHTPYSPDHVFQALQRKEVVVVTGGMGRGFFTTDTAATLCALELGAKRLIKGTRVKGVYDKDPIKNKDAWFYTKKPLAEIAQQKLGFMDQSALNLAVQYKLELVVYNALEKGGLEKAVAEKPGTGSWLHN